ncbi:MAG: peptide/nickel transport system permease protein [Candidatus Sumerlaeota bacterium]|nr:peptide/nickel transport system permease protein [Candidatus Sumerlaeota bacterium]
MRTLLLRRLLEMIPTLVGVSLLAFFIMKMTPGDPVRMMLGPEASPESIQMLREQLGLNRPWYSQYYMYTVEMATGELKSITLPSQSARERILARLPATIELAVAAMFFALLTSILVGVISASRRNSIFDNVSRVGVFIFLAMPSFWLGLELIILFARKLHWFPPAGRGTGSLDSHISHLILPAITLGVGTGASLSRILRSSMLEVLNADYIRTARAKGLRETRVVLKHALKSALIPFTTVAGISAGALLSGSVIVETVFNWPGVGSLLVATIKERDFPVTMGCILLLATVFVVVNSAVDMLYILFDPRIRVEGEKA